MILQIKCVGKKTLYLMHDKEEIGEYELADRVTAEIPIPYAKYSDGVFWFRLKTDENIDEKTHGAELGDETATAENPGEKKGLIVSIIFRKFIFTRRLTIVN